jgi:energy-converting hydrogenase Eha subunit A
MFDWSITILFTVTFCAVALMLIVAFSDKLGLSKPKPRRVSWERLARHVRRIN